ncbi:putative prolyl 4-hydroxylase 4 [Colletotrichum sidae]|uniref:Putative prolyl 4-hydroxylase 4 n=1 Tax=Colletotrichum sidae TaxID=1347389 RepID=A0A4R8TLV6_9PEZI|nr:putative prolyl 4-hydroxylase 4 [Colletotrichum sidae]
MLNHVPWSRFLLLCGALVPAILVLLWPRISAFSGPLAPVLTRVLALEPYPKTYSIRIMSYDPLIIYVVGFISWAERTHLLQIGESLYERSAVYDQDEERSVFDEERTSSTAWLPDEDPIVQRIIRRASTIQGYTPLEKHEELQLTRYVTGQFFNPHLDPILFTNDTYIHRLTTMFAYLESTCEKCGTQFPNLAINWTMEDPDWCNYVDCANQTAVTVKAIPGNALFWKNWDNDGQLDDRTTHAGLPPEGGRKTGLNIWTHG